MRPLRKACIRPFEHALRLADIICSKASFRVRTTGVKTVLEYPTRRNAPHTLSTLADSRTRTTYAFNFRCSRFRI